MERRLARRVIRAARPADLDAIEALENSAFESDRLSRRSLRYYLRAMASNEVPVVEDEMGLLGYAMIGFRKGSTVGRIFSLAVDGRAVRRGIGRDLLRACEDAARGRGRVEIRLEVRVDNTAAIALYTREGYARTGIEQDFYEDGAAAFLLRKRLDGAEAGSAASAPEL